MLSLRDYDSAMLGAKAYEQFLYEYNVIVSLDWSEDFDAKSFVSALLKDTDNVKVYCRVLDNLVLKDCLPQCFDTTLNQITKSITKNIKDQKSLKFSLNQFIKRNKPFAITDLVNMNYRVNVIKDSDKKNVSLIEYDGKCINLVLGNNDFNFNLIKSSYYDKIVCLPEFGLVQCFEVDHFCREINLIC